MLACLCLRQYPAVSKCLECDGSGTLLHCALCQRGFHQTCLQSGQPLSTYWQCPHCREVTEKEVNMQTARLREEQVKRKDAVLRKWKKLTKSDLAVFQTLHPDLCQKGHIHYPIEDLLLNSRPKLHGIKGKPLPVALPHPGLSDLLAVADFMHVFRSVLHVPPFSPLQLKSALTLNQETDLVKSLIVALETVGITAMGKRNISDNAHHFRFAEKLSMDLLPALPLCYLGLLEDLLWSWSGDDDYQAVLSYLQIDPAESHFYASYSLGKKLAVITALMQVALCTKTIRDEVQRLAEDSRKLTRLRKDLKSKAKYDKSVQIELEKAEKQRSETHLGPLVLGQDRDFREYWYSGSDKSGLYVRTREGEEDVWSYLDSAQCQGLMSALHSKGVRERRLKSEISAVKLVASSVEIPQAMDTEARLKGVKEQLLALESQLSASFQAKKYIWTLPGQAVAWQQAVLTASSDSHLKGLFQQFIDKATNPYAVLKGGEMRQVQAKYAQPGWQGEWQALGEGAYGTGALAWQVLTFMAACHIRLKRVRKEEYEDEVEKVGKLDNSESP